MYNQEFIDREDGVRLYDNGLVTYRIVLDRTQALWHIETVDGPLPAPLRDKRFTNPRLAAIALKIHADKAPERSALYRIKRKAEAQAQE